MARSTSPTSTSSCYICTLWAMTSTAITFDATYFSGIHYFYSYIPITRLASAYELLLTSLLSNGDEAIRRVLRRNFSGGVNKI